MALANRALFFSVSMYPESWLPIPSLTEVGLSDSDHDTLSLSLDASTYRESSNNTPSEIQIYGIWGKAGQGREVLSPNEIM